MLADADPQPDVHVVMAGLSQQQIGVNGLQVTGGGRGQGHRPWWWCGGHGLDAAQVPLHHLQGADLDSFGDGVDLDRVGQMVGVVDDHGQADEHQQQ